MKKIIYICLIFSNILALNFNASAVKDNAPVVRLRHREDTRKSLDDSSPKVLNTIGKLNYKKHKKNADAIAKKIRLNCTANLIAPIKKMGSDIILTAKHCLFKEIKLYNWESQNSKGEKVRRKAKVHYIDDANDQALLMLTKAVRYEEIKPLLINEDTFKMENFKKDNYIVGGFSVDYLGDYGKKLTYEDHISYIKTEDKKGEVGALTYQGDSGGAIIYKGKELHLNSLIKPDHFIFISLRYL